MTADDTLSRIRYPVLWNRLIAIVEEQARSLIKTAFSETVSEAGDLSAGVFDTKGRMVAQAITGTPGHVNSMAESVGYFLEKFPASTVEPGDHFITNDPWLSSGHLHDITVVSPAFHDGNVTALFACTCHQVDIGGWDSPRTGGRSMRKACSYRSCAWRGEVCGTRIFWN